MPAAPPCPSALRGAIDRPESKIHICCEKDRLAA
jgi:hypothetical protein